MYAGPTQLILSSGGRMSSHGHAVGAPAAEEKGEPIQPQGERDPEGGSPGPLLGDGAPCLDRGREAQKGSKEARGQ
jgi:hypothetical protein